MHIQGVDTMNFTNSNQIKSYLKKESEQTGISLVNCYNTFFARNLLQRISELSYGQLIVKGSFSQMVHLGKMIRPVTDIDLVSTTMDKNEALIVLFSAMYSENENDIIYDLSTYPKTTKTGIIKIKTVAKFDKICHPMTIDFNPISKGVLEIQYKDVPRVFIEDKRFYINTPSHEEHLAEKLCIISESIKPDVLNTRIKDFYDIYKLHGGNYDVEKFSYYYGLLLKKRNKISPDIVSCDYLNKEFIDRHRTLWDEMSKKYEFLDKSVNIDEAVYYTKGVLSEQIQKMKIHKYPVSGIK